MINPLALFKRNSDLRQTIACELSRAIEERASGGQVVIIQNLTINVNNAQGGGATINIGDDAIAMNCEDRGY